MSMLAIGTDPTPTLSLVSLSCPSGATLTTTVRVTAVVDTTTIIVTVTTDSVAEETACESEVETTTDIYNRPADGSGDKCGDKDENQN